MSGFFAGKQLLRKKGEEVEKIDGGKALEGKVVALYFSAMWCPTCRSLTPKIQRLYKAVNACGKKLEVILVSRDKEESDLNEYFVEHNGDWLAVPFGDAKIQECLAKYEVCTIPALKVIKSDGTLAVANAQKDVQERGRDAPMQVFEEWKKAAA